MNKYVYICAIDNHTRVKLNKRDGSTDKADSYINANYIHVSIISVVLTFKYELENHLLCLNYQILVINQSMLI